MTRICIGFLPAIYIQDLWCCHAWPPPHLMARTVHPKPRVYSTYISHYVQTFIRIFLGKKLSKMETTVHLIIMANKTNSGLKKQLKSLNF